MQPSSSTGISGNEDESTIFGHISLADVKCEAVCDRLHSVFGSPGGPTAFLLLGAIVAAMCRTDKC